MKMFCFAQDLVPLRNVFGFAYLKRFELSPDSFRDRMFIGLCWIGQNVG